MAYSYDPQPFGQLKPESSGRAYARDPYYRHFSYTYDSRKDAAQGRGDDTSRSPPLTTEINRFKRRSWPPPPSVEDENDSLSKEYPPVTPARRQDDGVPMRGTVDQEPLMIEVDNRERRFVLVPEASKGEATRKTAGEGIDMESTGAKSNKPPRLKTDINEAEAPGILDRRQPTPYAYTPVSTPRPSGDYFTPPDAVKRTNSKGSTSADNLPPKRTNSFRLGEAASDSSASRSRTETSDESDIDLRAADKMRTKRKAGRASFTDPRGPSSLLSPNIVSDPPRFSRTPSPNSATSATASKHEAARERSGRVTTAANLDPPRSIPTSKPLRAESMDSRRPVMQEYAKSAARNAERPWYPSPPSSPKLTGSSSANISPRDSLGSRPGSRAGSRPSSRPSSPVAFTLDVQQAAAKLSKSNTAQSDRYSDYGSSQKPKPAKPTPLSTSIRQESGEQLPKLRTDIQSPQPIHPTKPSAALPYPEDDHNFMMPTETDFSPVPQGLGVSFPSLNMPARARSANPPSTRYDSKSQQSARPELSARHSLAEGLPRSAVEASDKSKMLPDGASSKTKSTKDPSTASARLPVLPPCPRREFSRKYDDWYTIEDFEAFDVCPSCLEDIVMPTRFRKFFKRSPSRPSTMKIKCDFSSPWIRLAWLLTIKRGRQDLEMLYRISKTAMAEDECPGASESKGTMYGIPLENGAFLPTFTLCPADRKHIETLFPSLAGAFTRLPSTIKIDKICALRTSSKRFAAYLDVLADIDEKASNSIKGKADLTPLVALAKSFAYKQECQRDRILVDQTWHFPPTLPELTVCEECFDELIYPHIKKGPSIADRFSRSLQPLTAPHLSNQSSCQLYSPRMRRVWERSVEKGDWEYLKRKVRERREVERELREQQGALLRTLSRGGSVYAGSASGGVDRERLKRELDRIEAEWADWE